MVRLWRVGLYFLPDKLYRKHHRGKKRTIRVPDIMRSGYTHSCGERNILHRMRRHQLYCIRFDKLWNGAILRRMPGWLYHKHRE
jgi:hypothetical protein